MTNKVPAVIRLRGVRHNNLKNFDLDLPMRKLIVVTGLSGSGKSSLAFDTLFAEGQRRYIETFSPYARQFFDRMDKPQVDRIDGIPPAIAIEQRNSVKSTRSTVGTMTELCDHMKLLWPHLAQLYCRQCGQPVRKEAPQVVWEALGPKVGEGSGEMLVTFNLPLSEKLSFQESLGLISKQGYQRVLLDGQILRLDELAARSNLGLSNLTVVQDRLKLTETNRARFVEACEHAYHFGKGKLAVYSLNSASDGAGKVTSKPQLFSNRLHCAACDIEYREPSPALFSFNHPVGACPTCRGFGRTITIDYNLAIPDRSKTLADSAVKPWRTGHGLESQRDMARACRKNKVPMDIPFNQLPPQMQEWVINGEPDYGKDSAHEWPRAWYGVKGYFRWLESKAYKMHVRVLLSRYRAYSTCPECRGQRFQPESLLFKVPDANGSLLTLADFYQLSIEEAIQFIDGLVPNKPCRSRREEAESAIRNLQSEMDQSAIRNPQSAIDPSPFAIILNEIRSRLNYLQEVGLGYLTLDRPTRSLSGGETERVNLTTCLGTRLVNTLFVLDEPSVGLHARDTARLVRIVESLRDTGNTVVVVEHEAAVMRAADQIVDLGPGQGEAGGHVVFQGPFQRLLTHSSSLTGQYLSGRKKFETPNRRVVKLSTPKLIVRGANVHNLKNLTVEIPLSRFVCLTGVSGSGKTTLAREVLLPALETYFQAENSAPRTARPGADEDPNVTEPKSSDTLDEELETGNSKLRTTTLTGGEDLGRVVLVDQSPVGKTPRSNPVVYIGAFEDIRELFAQTELARQRGLKSSAFSFNSTQGQCERCRGAGFEKIEMQFLSDVYIRCPECNGRRYRPHILEVKLEAPSFDRTATESQGGKRRQATKPSTLQWSIADLLEATVDDTIQFLQSFKDSPSGRRAAQSLRLLQEVGLGYLRLGQPINTLSGGESQRLKLVSHLSEFERSADVQTKPTLFVFDEPTTGLHFEDIRVLLKVFQRLVNAGHSLVVIEHNLDVIRSADWIIDLGPEAGAKGGQLVAQGPPEKVAATPVSHTGAALRETGGSHGATP